MKAMNKGISLLLTLCIILSVVATLGLASGVSLTNAAGSATELWLKEGYDHMLVYGERKAIGGGGKPYRYDGGDSPTVYVPTTALMEYMNVIGGAKNWSVTVNGDDVSFKYKSTLTITMKVGEKWWKKNGTAQNGFKNDLKHTEGVLSMARAMHPDSAGSQFFIMHKTSPHLDGAYAAFGKVTEGMDIVNKIAEVPTNFSDRPLEEQKIKSMTVDTFGVDYPEPEKM